MLRSMTGFGRAHNLESDKNNILVEMKSVNHKYLDVNVKLPRSIYGIEEKIRRHISSKIHRGKVEIFITYKNYEVENPNLKLNKGVMKEYYSLLKEIKEELTDVRDDISISLIAKFPGIVEVEEQEEDLSKVWLELEKYINEATEKLLNMKYFEGENLIKDILEKNTLIKGDISKMEEIAPIIVNEYRDKLFSKFKELIEDKSIDESRIYGEISMYSDKFSIDEEITRLKSHSDQLIEIIKNEDIAGKKLDFLMQEMNREANTILSKSNNLNITSFALNIKNNIEKIREQVQNIE